MQIVTVGKLLAGKRLDYPASMHTNVTYERAPALKKVAEEQGKLDLG